MIDTSQPPFFRFAIQGGGGREARPFAEHGAGQSLPSLLVSYFYRHRWHKHRAKYELFRDYVLDSGAYSAATVKAKIDLAEYIAYCQDRVATDLQCTEIFALDVIGDWRASITNTEAMWSAGVRAIPTYHVGEPVSVLRQLAKDYPKIALGGAVGMVHSRKIAWAEACFAEIWPKPVHGLGFGSVQFMMDLPFHSVDATTWVVGPTKFGRWQTIPKGRRFGGDQALRTEVDHYIRGAHRAAGRWRKQYVELEAMIAANPIGLR